MRQALILAAVLLSAACRDDQPGTAPATTATVEAVPPAAEQASAAPMVLPVAPPTAAAPLPEDAARLVQRVQACEHFAGEEPYDAARARDLREQVEASCTGNAAELKRLRGKYTRDPAVLKALSALDPPEM